MRENSKLLIIRLRVEAEEAVERLREITARLRELEEHKSSASSTVPELSPPTLPAAGKASRERPFTARPVIPAAADASQESVPAARPRLTEAELRKLREITALAEEESRLAERVVAARREAADTDLDFTSGLRRELNSMSGRLGDLARLPRDVAGPVQPTGSGSLRPLSVTDTVTHELLTVLRDLVKRAVAGGTLH